MIALFLCIACQHGDHGNHVEQVVAAPPGMLGGVTCPCKGECVEALKPPVLYAASLFAQVD